MKNILQLFIVFIILKVGNIIGNIIEPIIFIPGSIIGMMILFILLITNVIKLNDIETISNFFLKHMGFFFIPLGVGLLESLEVLKETWLELIFILIISNILVMFAAGKTAEIFINRNKLKGE